MMKSLNFNQKSYIAYNAFTSLINTPTIQGDTSTRLNYTENGARYELIYICAQYNPEQSKWLDDCETIYDFKSPEKGVMCLCTHNTSFAVLMVSTLCFIKITQKFRVLIPTRTLVASSTRFKKSKLKHFIEIILVGCTVACRNTGVSAQFLCLL